MITHPTHSTRYSDSSHYDEKCTQCGATDMNPGLLEAPCPNAPAVDYDKLCSAAVERFPQVHATLAANEKPCLEGSEIMTAGCEEATAKNPSLLDFVTDAIYEETRHGTYDCIRVWEAWSVGTMRADDFVETCERADEIAATVLNKLLSHPAICRAIKLEEAMEKFPPLTLSHGPDDLKPIINWYREHIYPIETMLPEKLKENINA